MKLIQYDRKIIIFFHRF